MHPPNNRLWAPWRLSYVKNPGKTKGCFLCRYVRERRDRRNLVVGRSRWSVAVVNRFPYNNGHLLIAPKRHTRKMDSLNEAEILDFWALTTTMISRLDATLRPQGYNIGINLGRPGGAGLPGHLHLHIVPRWAGDTNYMPVVAQTKVLPMALEELYTVLTRTARNRRARS